MGVFDINGVYKAYVNSKGDKAKIVLQDVNLTVNENEFLCILGPSGCGKTTLLNMMAGFEFPLKGEVLFNGKKVDGPGTDRGVIFQEYSLMPWTDVQRNVAFGIDRERYNGKERMELALKYLDLVGLRDVAKSRPNSLSGGMKQRVAIARTLAMEPDALLMDEPFCNLDEQTKKHMDAEILRLWNANKTTVVFITHSIDEALSLGTRIMLMSSSPGRFIRSWELPVDMDRDHNSDQYMRLRDEIYGALVNVDNIEERG